MQLQWGRVLMNAETRPQIYLQRDRHRASMGPRSHERGNIRIGDSAWVSRAASMGPRSHERGNTTSDADVEKVLAGALQWGRVLMNAETWPRTSLWKSKGSLQWGRVLMNAETQQLPLQRAQPVDASMGPRSHERGNFWFCWADAEIGTASMGPRSHERGNQIRISPTPSLKWSLQWGRVLMNAET